MDCVEKFRRARGLKSLCSTCFDAARIAAVLIDDGLNLDKKHDIEWHKSFVPLVGRILRIEHLAETILHNVTLDFCYSPPNNKCSYICNTFHFFRVCQESPAGSNWTLEMFTEKFVGRLKSYPFSIILEYTLYFFPLPFMCFSLAIILLSPVRFMA